MKVISKKDKEKLFRQAKDSHKGQNGRLLVIGGSKLFHASVFWTADVASRIVDLVHFSSPAMENNELVRKKAKEGFWNGIVVPWEKVEEYIREDDCIVIGPGMPRKEGLEKGERATGEIVDRLLKNYPDKRWVVDGGALQEMNPSLLTETFIITPHLGELKRLIDNTGNEFLISKSEFLNNFKFSNNQIQKIAELVSDLSINLGSVTILLKGVSDLICKREECVEVEGGNEGMTKGGTGDVLAGLVGGLYCKNNSYLAAKVGSLVNKIAGDRLYKKVGAYFNASDLVEEVPKVLKEVLDY